MPNNTYLFYDIETTGLNKCFDQVLQFAAIRTDEKLNELAHYEIHVRLNNDVIPSPYAVITHRIGPSEFLKGESELTAIQKIHALLNTPGTISIGYNSLGFDDEFLRFSFYRNLLPPYTHQYANRCGRMDIYPIAQLYYLFKRAIITWPENNLKLENITQLNQLTEGLAHNAMVDVKATLALTKKFFQDPSMWTFVSGYFQKSVDDERIKNSESTLYIGNQSHPIGLLINGKIGAKDNYAAPVVLLGQHLHYKNQQVFLRLDTADLINTKKDDVTKTTRVIKKRLAEPPLFLPLKERYLNLLSEDRQKIMKENQLILSEHNELFDIIRQYYQQEKYPEIPNHDVDAALYNIAFPSAQEEKLFRDFHAAKPSEKLSIAEKFPNPIRKTQALRIIRRHFPEISIPAEIFSETPIDFRGEKKYTLSQAKADIAEIEAKKTINEEQRALLSTFAQYISQATEIL